MTNYELLARLLHIYKTLDHESHEASYYHLEDLIKDVKAIITKEKDGQQMPELIQAVTDGNISLVRVIISDKATDINIEDNKGRTALFWAVYDNNYDIAKLLLSVGADLDICDYKGRTPLALAIDDGMEDIMDLLLEHRAYERHEKF